MALDWSQPPARRRGGLIDKSLPFQNLQGPDANGLSYDDEQKVVDDNPYQHYAVNDPISAMSALGSSIGGLMARNRGRARMATDRASERQALGSFFDPPPAAAPAQPPRGMLAGVKPRPVYDARAASGDIAPGARRPNDLGGGLSMVPKLPQAAPDAIAGPSADANQTDEWGMNPALRGKVAKLVQHPSQKVQALGWQLFAESRAAKAKADAENTPDEVRAGKIEDLKLLKLQREVGNENQGEVQRRYQEALSMGRSDADAKNYALGYKPDVAAEVDQRFADAKKMGRSDKEAQDYALNVKNEPGTKEFKEYQTKDAAYSDMLQRSDKTIDTLMTGNGYRPQAAINSVIPDSWNLVNSSSWQQYQQSAREGIAAILRKDTGAAVTQSEWDLYFPMYYPQPGDGDAVIKQKAAARKARGEALRSSSSGAYDVMYPHAAASGAKEPTPEHIQMLVTAPDKAEAAKEFDEFYGAGASRRYLSEH